MLKSSDRYLFTNIIFETFFIYQINIIGHQKRGFRIPLMSSIINTILSSGNPTYWDVQWMVQNATKSMVERNRLGFPLSFTIHSPLLFKGI